MQVRYLQYHFSKFQFLRNSIYKVRLDLKRVTGRHALVGGGAKPASASTLGDQKHYSHMEMARLVILLRGFAKPCKIHFLGGITPCWYVPTCAFALLAASTSPLKQLPDVIA